MPVPPVIFCVDLVVLRSAIEVLEMRTMLHLNSQALSSRAWMTTNVDAFVLFYIGRVPSRKAGARLFPVALDRFAAQCIRHGADAHIPGSGRGLQIRGGECVCLWVVEGARFKLGGFFGVVRRLGRGRRAR